MRWDRSLTMVQAHAEGEVGRVITGGVAEVPGDTMLDKKRYLEREADWIRRLALFEPRGAPSISANLILPPVEPEADAGMIVMESVDYPTMSGSNAMCVVTTLLETGVIEMHEPISRVILDTPAGLVTAEAACRAGKCERVSLTSVPAFVNRLDVHVETKEYGTITCDVAFGGAFFALINAQDLGFELVPAEARDLVEVGQRVTQAAQQQISVKHPRLPEIDAVTFTHFGTPADSAGVRKSAVVVQPGRLDRSPCGTGTMAKLAALCARGEIALGEQLIHESLIGTRFVAVVVGETTVGNHPAIIPKIAGRAWITATMQIGLDPSDPFPAGFVLPDTWGPDACELIDGVR